LQPSSFSKYLTLIVLQSQFLDIAATRLHPFGLYGIHFMCKTRKNAPVRRPGCW
jgi:hypothetical protein